MLEELKTEKIADYFYDRQLRADGGLFNTIDFHLKECDIAIAMLSENYYNSVSCSDEKKKPKIGSRCRSFCRCKKIK